MDFKLPVLRIEDASFTPRQSEPIIISDGPVGFLPDFLSSIKRGPGAMREFGTVISAAANSVRDTIVLLEESPGMGATGYMLSSFDIDRPAPIFGFVRQPVLSTSMSEMFFDRQNAIAEFDAFVAASII